MSAARTAGGIGSVSSSSITSAAPANDFLKLLTSFDSLITSCSAALALLDVVCFTGTFSSGLFSGSISSVALASELSVSSGISSTELGCSSSEESLGSSSEASS